MSKKIEKKQKELSEMQLDREKKKARYDSLIVILESQRGAVRQLETNADICLKEYVELDNNVKILIEEIRSITDVDNNQSEK